jgi:hypothetical protein
MSSLLSRSLTRVNITLSHISPAAASARCFLSSNAASAKFNNPILADNANISRIQYENGIPTSYDPSKKVQDKLLFTPGPLTTSYPVKLAMNYDLGSRDNAFVNVIKSVRQGLLDVAGVSSAEYTAVPMQGSG